jgi:hypothetical protein
MAMAALTLRIRRMTPVGRACSGIRRPGDAVGGVVERIIYCVQLALKKWNDPAGERLK